MAIVYHEQSKTFHLYNSSISYLIRIMENGQPENLYYGRKLRDRESFSHQHEEGERSHLVNCLPEPSLLSMQYTRQECPVYGTGDFRDPALTIRQTNGSRISCFKYSGYSIEAGKDSLLPLPATYVEAPAEASTLKLTLYDEVSGTELVLSYTIYEAYPVICRNVRILQKGEETITLERVMSSCVEFIDKDFEFVHLAGAWSRERNIKTRTLEMGIQSVQGLAGTCPGAEHNPFIALKRPDATEDIGEVYGFSFVYSGNFLAQVEVSTHELTRVMMGIHPEGFSWTLKNGESFQTPEVVMVYSDAGLGGMSRVYHRLYRTRLVRGKYRDLERPILLNNWEATYFDFNEEKLLKIASAAQKRGIEMFVLDDGWFGARNDDYRGLGDWKTNLDKLPSGLGGLSSKIEALGMKFGLWVELEMVNKDSDLYRTHPDWILSVPGRYDSPSRHQYVLDFSRREVVDYIYDMITETLSDASVSYIKWDMNRYMTEAFSAACAPEEQGKVMHRYILGVYDLYERLRARFPEILFESCASGGARFDPGMLFFAPQTWCSDDTDAVERLKIQYGTSLVYPTVAMGSHVSAVPNHQLGRITPIETRAAVAYFGTFGYELDLNCLPEEELEAVSRQVEFMKRYRKLLQIDGDFYRILSPFEGNETAWITVSGDKTEAVAGFYQVLNRVNASWLRLKLKGLDPDMLYEVSVDESRVTSVKSRPEHPMEQKFADGTASYRAYGDELMYAGIPIDRVLLNRRGGDFAAIIYTLKKVQ